MRQLAYGTVSADSRLSSFFAASFTPALRHPVVCHLLGSGNQLGLHQPALPLSHRTLIHSGTQTPDMRRPCNTCAQHRLVALPPSIMHPTNTDHRHIMPGSGTQACGWCVMGQGSSRLARHAAGAYGTSRKVVFPSQGKYGLSPRHVPSLPHLAPADLDPPPIGDQQTLLNTGVRHSQFAPVVVLVLLGRPPLNRCAWGLSPNCQNIQSESGPVRAPSSHSAQLL